MYTHWGRLNSGIAAVRHSATAASAARWICNCLLSVCPALLCCTLLDVLWVSAAAHLAIYVHLYGLAYIEYTVPMDSIAWTLLSITWDAFIISAACIILASGGHNGDISYQLHRIAKILTWAFCPLSTLHISKIGAVCNIQQYDNTSPAQSVSL